MRGDVDSNGLKIITLAEGQDPDDIITKSPEEWKRLTSTAEPGDIVIAFDGDEAGIQATLEAIDKNYNLIFEEEGESKDNNPNWVRYAENYNLFLDELFTMGVNGYLRRNGEIKDTQVRKWPIKRLLTVLDTWDRLSFSLLYYGNSYLIEYYLPKVKERRLAVERELIRRASPKRKSIIPAGTPGEFLSADYVKDHADFKKVFEYYFTGSKVEGDELIAFCPFCSRQKPHLHCNLKTGLWRCMTCHESGSVFQLVMKIEKTTFPTALRKVAELGGVSL